MRASLQRILNVQAGEGRLTFLLFAEMFLLGVGFNFVETSVFPLFLSEFDAGTLPYLYIINAVVVALLTTFYLRLGRYMNFARQLVVLLAFIVLLAFGFWLALTLGGGRPVVFALPVLFQIAVNMAQLGFWTMTARLMNLRQSKRLYGLVGSGMWVAIVLTGFLVAPIVRAVGTVNLLLISAVGFSAALVLLFVIVRSYSGALNVAETGGAIETESRSLGAYLRSPYIALMFGLTIAAWLSFYFVDNIFYNRISAQFPDQAALSAFMGLYLAGLGIFTLFNNLFLAGFIVNRFGVRVGLFVLPVLLFVVMLAFSVVGAGWGLVPLLFWLATLGRVLDLGLLFSVDQTAQSILYQPLPASERARVQTIDNGIIRMVAVGLAGGSLLLLNQVLAFDVVRLAFVLLAIIVGWLALSFLTSRAYPRALTAALARRRLTGVTLSLEDNDTVLALKESLRNPNPGPALYALGLLADNRPEALIDALPALLAHPAAPVRMETLRRIESLGLGTDGLQTVAETDPDPRVRGAAWQALAVAGDAATEAALLNHVEGGEHAVRLGALVGLRNHGRPAAQSRVESVLETLAESSEAEDRLIVVQAIEAGPRPADTATLLALLGDGEVAVRREALRAAGLVRFPELWPAVIDAVGQRSVHVAAVSALSAGGDVALPAIAAAMSRPDTPRETMLGLARVCGRIGSAAAVQTLLASLDHPGDLVRSEALLALSHAGYTAGGDGAPAVRRQIAVETTRAARLLAALRDTAPAEELNYLRRVLQGEFEAARERIYVLLSFLYDRAAMLDVRESLGRGRRASSARQAYALEILDLRLSGDLKALVMPLSEELSPAVRLQRLGGTYNAPPLSPAERVEALLLVDKNANRWLQIAAIHAAGCMRCSDPQLPQLLAALGDHPDPVMREVAAEAYTLICDGSPTRRTVGERSMLSTIEKVIILKDVDLFAETPDELLAEVAGLLAEVEFAPGQAIFGKGDSGDSLYIIVSGEVRVHDGDYVINTLGESQVFGEMALLGPGPRMASATAETEALLLRLDQGPFYELMDTRSEVARGIIRVLSARLRQRVQEVASLRTALSGA